MGQALGSGTKWGLLYARRWFARFSALFLLIGCCFLVHPAAIAQQSSASIRQDNSTLPEAPQPQTGSATISGTVFDSSNEVLPGAQVTLVGSSNSPTQTLQSGSDGQFVFATLPPGTYTLRVSAPGMTEYVSDIRLQSGETRILREVTLAVSGGTTSVTVSGNKEELAEEQLHIAEKQRVGGVIPNFYSAYNWNAPPMEAKQKIHLGLRSVLDPVSFLSVAGIAGAEQYQGVFPAYGSGFEGYAKRYGAAFANHASGTLLGRAVFPSIFHQDPRYFYKGKGTIRSRAFYAIAAAVVAKGDNGHWEPNYSRVTGNFSAAALSNLYYPAADRGGSLVLLNGLASTGADAAANLIREFLLKRITSHVSEGAEGQP